VDEPEGWRGELKKGNSIDFVIHKNDLEGWSTGTVLERDDKEFVIAWDGDNEDSFKIPISSKVIAPYGTYTRGKEWRTSLKVGDLVDCCDTGGMWYLSTVLKTDYIAQPPKVFIGYRIYKEDGKKIDSDGKTYQGWSSSFDEWVDAFSLRIQAAKSLSHEGYIECKSGDREYDKFTVNDTCDIILNSPGGLFNFCIERTDKESSEFVVNLLNEFGVNNGFDKILERLKGKALIFGMFLLKE
jgi:hypothetical protein